MPYQGPGKLVRITPDAHRAAKIAAAIHKMTMEEWVTAVVLSAASKTKYSGYQQSPKSTSGRR